MDVNKNYRIHFVFIGVLALCSSDVAAEPQMVLTFGEELSIARGGAIRTNALGHIAFEGVGGQNYGRLLGLWKPTGGGQLSTLPQRAADEGYFDFDPDEVSFTLMDQGSIVFNTYLEGTSNDRQGNWIWDGNTVDLLAIEDSEVPSLAGFDYSHVGNPVAGAKGVVYYNATVASQQQERSDESFTGLWKHSEVGGVALVAQSGSPIPGTESTFSRPRALVANNTGDIVVRNDRGNGEFDLFLYSKNADRWEPVLDNATFAQQSFPELIHSTIGLSDSGRLATWVSLGNEDGNPHGADNRSAIVVYQAGKNLNLVALENEPIVSPNRGDTLQGASDVSINSTGQITFSGRYKHGETISPAIWRQSEGEELRLAYSAETWNRPIPLQMQPTQFSNSVNDSGQVALSIRFEFEREYEQAIWAEDHSGKLTHIVSTGAPIVFNNNESDNVRSLMLLGIDRLGHVSYQAFFDDGTSAIFRDNTVARIIPGDFDADGLLTAYDIDALNDAIRTNAEPIDFDLNDDQILDVADRTFWVEHLAGTFYGDSNLDGMFDSGDFVDAFELNRYEKDQLATWTSGDWNGDGRFNSSDLTTAFQSGQYEKGPRAGAQSVPEPAASLLFAFIGIAGFARHRRQLVWLRNV